MELTNPITARIRIREFSRELQGRCGVDARVLEKDIIRAKRLNHIALEEYEWVGYYARTEEQKRSISTLWTRAELRKKYTNKHYKAILMNKYIFAKVFSEDFGRRFYLSSVITRENFESLCGESGKVVYKPLNKGQGRGVLILKAATPGEREETFARIKSMPEGMVEEWICQHPDIDRLYAGAVSIVRFYSVCTPAGTYLFSPVLTTAASMDISNGCQDALTACVDIRTGVVLTHAVDQINIADVPVHPATGTAFKGLQLPFWQETVDMMCRAVPQASYISNIGWDVAIGRHGPMLVEANTIPGFNTAQFRGFAHLTNGYGYQPIFDEAVNGIPFRDRSNYEKVLIKLK